MHTKVPKAWDTIWAQEHMAEVDAARPSQAFRYPGHDQKPTGEVVYLVNKDGECRRVDAALVQTESWRVNEAMGAADVPVGLSSMITSSPARGRLDAYSEVNMIAVGTEDFVAVEERYHKGAPGRVRDIFDEITDQVLRRNRRAEPPFSVAQVAAARAYCALHERLASSGLKCSSAFDPKLSGGGERDLMDLVMADRQRLIMFHAAIGSGLAKTQKRKAKTKRIALTTKGLGARRPISTRALVDAVCLYGKPVSGVLRLYGWSVTGKNRKTLMAALCAALSRMQGI